MYAIIQRMTWTVFYYSERVRKEVLGLPAGVLASYLRLVELMELYGADLRLPHSRAMGGGLFELRPKGPEGIGRVFYCMTLGHRIVILHSFVKKTAKTPKGELRIAQKRLKEVRNG